MNLFCSYIFNRKQVWYVHFHLYGDWQALTCSSFCPLDQRGVSCSNESLGKRGANCPGRYILSRVQNLKGTSTNTQLFKYNTFWEPNVWVSTRCQRSVNFEILFGKFREGHKNWRNFNCLFDTYYIMSNRGWRFSQFLWLF